MENESAIYRVLKGEPLLRSLSLQAWNEYDDLKNINDLKKFAEYASVSWEDGGWLVVIEKVEGVRVDAEGERSASLATAIHTAIKTAQQSVQRTLPSDSFICESCGTFNRSDRVVCRQCSQARR